MNTSGHIKEVIEDENGYRQFIINCLGNNDQRKYFSISPFGIDFNIPVNTRSLTTDSVNKDQKYNLGVLNKVKIEDLNPGECAIFSTNEDGLALAGFLKFRNDGTTEFNGDADFLIGYAKSKEGFDKAVEDLNKTNAELNKIITALNSWTPVPNDGGLALKTLILGNLPVNVVDSIASIDDSKKENLKTE